MKSLFCLGVIFFLIASLTACAGMSASNKMYNEISKYVTDNMNSLNPTEENEFYDYEASPVCSGNYYAVGDYEEMLTPYLWIDTDKNEFSLGAGSIISYAEHGKYEVADGKVIATSQSTTFEFEIKDKNTLVLIDNGDNDYFKIPINTQFVYSEDLR